MQVPQRQYAEQLACTVGLTPPTPRHTHSQEFNWKYSPKKERPECDERQDFPPGETLLNERITATRDAPLSWRTTICGTEMFSWTCDFMSHHQKGRKKEGRKRSTYGPVINTTDETLLFAFVSAPTLLPDTRRPFK